MVSSSSSVRTTTYSQSLPVADAHRERSSAGGSDDRMNFLWPQGHRVGSTGRIPKKEKSRREEMMEIRDTLCSPLSDALDWGQSRS